MRRIGLIWLAVACVASGLSPAHGQSSASAFTHGTRYDAMRRIVGTIGPDPDGGGPLLYPAVRNTYDADGRLTKVETGQLSTWQPEGVAPSAWGAAFAVLRTVDTTYDPMDRKLTDKLSGTSATQKLTQYSYDIVGRLQCTAVRMNLTAALPATACTLATPPSGDGPDRVTQNSYDPVGQLLLVQEAFGTALQRNQVTYTYTPDGKQEFVTDANGNKAQFAYDGFDRRSFWYFPSKTTPGVVNTADYEQYGYDANNNRTSLRKRDGQVINYTYDAINRLILKDIPGSEDYYYSYDYRNLELYVHRGSPSGGGVDDTYDNAGRKLTAFTNMGGFSRTISYQWDADGNRIRRTDPDGIYFTTDYDGLDRSTTTHDNSGANLFTFSYDPLGRRSGVVRANATSSAYVYDAADRLASLSHDLSGTANDLTLGFTYNADDQVTVRTADKDAYAYPNSINGTKAYAPNGLNQYGTVAGTTYAYDANGNLTSDGGTTYGYDVENRLISATGAHAVTITYDPLGRMAYTIATAAKSYFLWDGDDLIGEFDQTGAQVRRYVNGPGEDDPQIWYLNATLTSRRFLYPDEQGSIIAVADTAGLNGINSYDEYGAPSTTAIGRYKYTGQLWVSELGIYYYKARFYNQIIGRFMQTDPVGYTGQFNLYAYVESDPVNHQDPSGLCTPPTGSIICTPDAPNTSGIGLATPPAVSPNPSGANPNGQSSSGQQNPQPSWQPGDPFPNDPSGLGPDWVPDKGHKAPNDERFVNPNGDKVEWHPGIPGKPGEMGKDHWHWVPGGKKEKPHYAPGESMKSFYMNHRTSILIVGGIFVGGAIILSGGAAAPLLAL